VKGFLSGEEPQNRPGRLATAQSLGLVTQALLVPVQLHALAALVLRDLGFAFLLDGSHRGFVLVLSGLSLIDNLVQRIFDDAFGTE